MMTGQEETVKYIRKKLKTGYPAGELENDLLNRGYSQEEVSRLLLEASANGSVTEGSGQAKKTEMHFLSLAGASFLITGIAMMAIRTWLSEYVPAVMLLGAICLGAGLIISYQKKQDKGSL